MGRGGWQASGQGTWSGFWTPALGAMGAQPHICSVSQAARGQASSSRRGREEGRGRLQAPKGGATAIRPWSRSVLVL